MKCYRSPIICPLFCAVISGFRLPAFLETPFKELFHFYGEHGGSFPSLLSEKKKTVLWLNHRHKRPFAGSQSSLLNIRPCRGAPTLLSSFLTRRNKTVHIYSVEAELQFVGDVCPSWRRNTDTGVGCGGLGGETNVHWISSRSLGGRRV